MELPGTEERGEAECPGKQEKRGAQEGLKLPSLPQPLKVRELHAVLSNKTATSHLQLFHCKGVSMK